VSAEARKKCREVGIHGFLSKPVTQEAFLKVLQEIPAVKTRN
jgi:CheY-like chemotaxis protein